MNECSGAKARVGDVALLHDVARRLERLGAGRKLTVLDIEDSAGVEQMGELRGVAVRVDQAHRLGEPLESLLPFVLSGVSRREISQQRGALATLSLQGQGRCGLVTDRAPIPAFDRGLGRKATEHATPRSGKRLVADEVVEDSAKTRSQDRERPKRW